jgi:hypothetical protein
LQTPDLESLDKKEKLDFLDLMEYRASLVKVALPGLLVLQDFLV